MIVSRSFLTFLDLKQQMNIVTDTTIQYIWLSEEKEETSAHLFNFKICVQLRIFTLNQLQYNFQNAIENVTQHDRLSFFSAILIKIN